MLLKRFLAPFVSFVALRFCTS